MGSGANLLQNLAATINHHETFNMLKKTFKKSKSAAQGVACKSVQAIVHPECHHLQTKIR
jgi:hypothetical protein